MPDIEPNGTPAASDPAGQRPMTDNGSTPTQSADPNAPQTPAAQANDPTPQQQDQTIQNPAAKAAADEAARYRRELRDAQKRLAEYEAAQKAAEDAKLSETERLKKQYAEAQAEAAQAKLQARERILRAEIRAAATAAGINPQLAARIIDLSEVVDDDNGDPTNIADLLTKAATEYGIKPGASQQSGTPQAQAAATTPNVGGTNPPRQNGPLTITANQYLDPAFKAEYQKTHGVDLLKAVNAGKVTIV